MKLLQSLLAWLPRQCHLCRLTLSEIPRHSLWCDTCVERLTSSAPRCQDCGLTTLHTVAQCGQCLSEPPPWDRLYCINDYKAPLKEYIQQLKYQRQFWLAADLAPLLADKIENPAPELIPVPLHWRRMWRRGFNQSSELAEQLARTWRKQNKSYCVNHEILRRVIATPQQKGLDKKQRLRNTRHAFQLVQPPKHDHVALVDDVVTTGATIKPICQALRKAGVKHIDVYCLSRTPSPK
ncbi:ComF family protein [Vibrio gangliei]|uniref:ComF family protein n=1 Tax=Vibrio gangliei TaxID=2077090 RepID=UPI000D013D45|nr:ComF family protein [Vibrio gangliei]